MKIGLLKLGEILEGFINIIILNKSRRHSKALPQQSAATAKRCHSKAPPQLSAATAKRCHSKAPPQLSAATVKSRQLLSELQNITGTTSRSSKETTGLRIISVFMIGGGAEDSRLDPLQTTGKRELKKDKRMFLQLAEIYICRSIDT
jgi:hypothetical protein